VFLKWFRLQAGYWRDLSILSRTFGSSDSAHPVPEVFLVAVQHPMHDINPFSVDPLETTLEDAIGYDPDHPINVEEVLAMITKEGSMYFQAPYIAKWYWQCLSFSPTIYRPQMLLGSAL